MLCRLLGVLFLFLLAGYGTVAYAYIDPPVLVPSHPKVGDFLKIEVRAGVCDGFPGAENSAAVTRVGSDIRMLIPSIHDEPDWCNLPPEIIYHFEIGQVPAGTYDLKVDRRYAPLFGEDVVEPIGAFSFDVSDVAIGSIPIPSTGLANLSLLGLVLATSGLTFLRSHFLAGWRAPGVALSRPRKHAFAMLVASQAYLTPGMAQEPVKYVEVLVVSGSGAPTAEQIVEHDFSGNDPPPLQGLTVGNPQSAFYLLPIRATGDFLTYLDSHPSSVRAELERYVVVRYPANTDMAPVLSALRADPYVLATYEPANSYFSISSSAAPKALAPKFATGDGTQYGRTDLNIDAAWLWVGGYALVGDADSGLAVDHPALRQFSPDGHFVGGNFVPAASFDIGNVNGIVDFDVDEAQPFPASGPCDVDSDGFGIPAAAGHGTHVAGLIAANDPSGAMLRGTCRHCGIAEVKVNYSYCLIQSPVVRTENNPAAIAAAVTILADTGAQVINMSFGHQDGPMNYCGIFDKDADCLAIAHAAERGTAMTTSSGNQRTSLQFPARDDRTIAVGGFDQNLALWDDSPGSFFSCPAADLVGELGKECGSNYTTNNQEARQELVASSKSVLSTTYPGKDWNNFGCGDSYGGTIGDGRGLCTGTSMSAPQIAGIVGMLRSINPLVLPGHPIPEAGEAGGLRTVLAQTTVQAQLGQGWTPAFGYGRPDAEYAAKRMLGEVAGRTVKNRVTPLFRFHSIAANDYLDTTSPQFGIAVLINQASSYLPQGTQVPNYNSFPGYPLAFPSGTPRASVYVMTTEFTPRQGLPNLVPLYMVERSRPFPVGCVPGAVGCNGGNRDFTLLTTTQEIEAAHTGGFSLRTIQGYVYEPCSPEPGCIPPGTQKFYRACNEAVDDCATFLESERIAFEAAGYIQAYPTPNKLMGYAYPAIDNDNDGLVDGFEMVIGTDPLNPDSNRDGIPDGVQFPMVQLPVGDPCGGVPAKVCASDVIFRNDFQLVP